MARPGMTPDQVEQEIKRLEQSPYVKLAQKEERLRNARRQRMYMLRYFEKRGTQLAEMGVTDEMLEWIAGYFRERDMI